MRLQHMRDAAREAQNFTRGHERTDLNSNRMLALALVHLIEVIGEAASHESAQTCETVPNIPWPLVVAMCNRLVHGYFDIDLDRVWDTVTDDLPPLIDAVEAAPCVQKGVCDEVRMSNEPLKYEVAFCWSNADERLIGKIPELPGCLADG